MSRRLLWLLLAGFLVMPALPTLAGGGGGRGTPGPSQATVCSLAQCLVNIREFAFAESPLTVTVGTNVTWRNLDEAYHNVVSGTPEKLGGPLQSQLLKGAATYSFRFTEPSEYVYFCSIHPFMLGKIVAISKTASATSSREPAGSVNLPGVLAATAGIVATLALLAASRRIS